MTELLDLIRLTMVPGVGPQTTPRLAGAFGSAGRVLVGDPRASCARWPNVGPKLAEKIARARAGVRRRGRAGTVPPAGCAGRPARTIRSIPPPLENIPDPPSLLYCKGRLEPRDQLAIAMVGSRHCTPYGLRIAERLAAGLARVGLTVVSGLARGIDAAAHRGAIKAGGRTIAVLANGLASVYPPEHEDLARARSRPAAS